MIKNKNIIDNLLSKINILLLGIIVFLIPIHQKYLSLFIGLWAITSVFLVIRQKNKITPNKSLFISISLYLMLAIGLLWTDNKDAGGFDLEVKVSLIIFPLLFLYLKLTKVHIRFVIYAFIIGILCGASYLYYHAYLIFKVNQAADSFFYVNLSTIIHPSYLSFYVCTALLILFLDLKYSVLHLFKIDMLYVGLIIILFVYNLFLLSKIGIIVSILMIVFFTIQWIITKHKYILGISVLSCLIFSIYFTYQNSPYTKQRVNEFMVGLTATEGNASNSSTAIRFKIWKQGIASIKETPILGHGTGDVKDVLMEKYKQNNIDDAYAKKLNAHNQFIQVGIALGVVGLLLFLSLFFYALKDGILDHNYFIVGFIIISLLFMFPESILENQAGTIFFGLFVSLLNQKTFFKI